MTETMDIDVIMTGKQPFCNHPGLTLDETDNHLRFYRCISCRKIVFQETRTWRETLLGFE